MPETTLHGVTLLSKARSRKAEVFELGVSTAGIEVRRSGQEPRLLSWDRIATWDIEQRRRGVVLELRGGGSVTPLLVPDWTVEDLDRLLCDVTAHLARTTPLPEEDPDLVLPASAPDAPCGSPPPPLDLDLPAPPPMAVPDLLLDDLPDPAGSGSGSGAGTGAGTGTGAWAAPEMDLDLPAPPPGPEESHPDMELSLGPPPPAEEGGT
ncbi:MAG: hypothetical protein ACLPVF_13040 [Acidimicrobiales bacterium]